MSLPVWREDVAPFSCNLLDDVNVLPCSPVTMYLTDNTGYLNCCLRFLLRIWQFWAPKFKNFSWGADPPSLQYLGSFPFSPKSLFGASKNYQKCVSKFYSTWLANRQWLYNGPIMARTHILVHRWGGGLEQGFWRSFADGLNQSLTLSVAQATPNGELTCRLINLLLSSLFQMLTYSVGVEF